MNKKVKLSPAQQRVVDKMREGGRLFKTRLAHPKFFTYPPLDVPLTLTIQSLESRGIITLTSAEGNLGKIYHLNESALTNSGEAARASGSTSEDE